VPARPLVLHAASNAIEAAATAEQRNRKKPRGPACRARVICCPSLHIDSLRQARAA
jgi:hypothetical protein